MRDMALAWERLIVFFQAAAYIWPNVSGTDMKESVKLQAVVVACAFPLLYFYMDSKVSS